MLRKTKCSIRSFRTQFLQVSNQDVQADVDQRVGRCLLLANKPPNKFVRTHLQKYNIGVVMPYIKLLNEDILRYIFLTLMIYM